MFEDLKNAFLKLKENTYELARLNDRLFQVSDFNEWNKFLYERSKKIREIFIQNEKNIDIIKASFKDGLNEAKARFFYETLSSFKDEEINDYGLTIPLLGELMKYYEEKGSKDYILLFLYLNYPFEIMEYYLRMGNFKDKELVRDCFLKAIECKSFYFSLTPKNRSKYYIAFYNLTSVLPDLVKEYSKDIIKFYQEMLDFYFSKKIQEIEKDNEYVKDEILYVVEAFCYGYGRFLWSIGKERDAFFKLVEKSLKLFDFLSDDVKRVMIIILKYYHKEYDDSMLFYRLNEINQEYMDMNLSYDGTEDSILEFCNWMDVSESLIQILSKIDMPNEEKKAHVKRITKPILEYISQVGYKNYTSYFDDISSDLVREMLPFLDGMDQKLDLILRLVIERQPITYIHSLMVKRISEEIAFSIIKNKIEIFQPLFDIGLCGGDLLDYIGIGALIHDLGKCLTVGVINAQGRRLVEEEYACVRLHPERSMIFLDNDPDFKKYHDIMLGHHKWYDGTKGYPASFDNTKSKYKIVIDLISIADSIDAATDILGRNYAQGKDFDTLLDELILEAGSRYNKEIVDLIASDKVLQEKLRYLTKDGREKVYFEAYKEISEK